MISLKNDNVAFNILRYPNGEVFTKDYQVLSDIKEKDLIIEWDGDISDIVLLKSILDYINARTNKQTTLRIESFKYAQSDRNFFGETTSLLEVYFGIIYPILSSATCIHIVDIHNLKVFQHLVNKSPNASSKKIEYRIIYTNLQKIIDNFHRGIFNIPDLIICLPDQGAVTK